MNKKFVQKCKEDIYLNTKNLRLYFGKKPSKQKIQIFIKSITGQTTSIMVHQDGIIQDIMDEITKTFQRPVSWKIEKLIYTGHLLNTDPMAEIRHDTGIAVGSTIHHMTLFRGD